MKRIAAIIAVVVFATVAAAAECSEADRKILIKFDHDWTEANAKGDRTVIATFYADEFLVFPNMTGKSAAIDGAMAAFERNKANPQAATRTTTDHYAVTCTPTTAAMTHRNVTFNPTANDGKGATTYSRSVHFLEKRNGKWVAVANAGGPLSDSDMLRYMELDWIEAVRSKNFDWMEKNYATDFTEISFIDGSINNKRQTIDAMKADKTIFESMEISDVNIRVDGNSAVVTGVGQARGKDSAGKPFDIRLRYTDTFVRRDGRWQAWASHATMIAPQQTAAKN